MKFSYSAINFFFVVRRFAKHLHMPVYCADFISK
jgi:hypothetical protein